MPGKTLIGIATSHMSNISRQVRRAFREFKPQAIVLEGPDVFSLPAIRTGELPSGNLALSTRRMLYKTEDWDSPEGKGKEYFIFPREILYNNEIIFNGTDNDNNAAIELAMRHNIPLFTPENFHFAIVLKDKFAPALEDKLELIPIGVPNIIGKQLSFYPFDFKDSPLFGTHTWSLMRRNELVGSFINHLFVEKELQTILQIMGTHHFNSNYEENNGWDPFPDDYHHHVQDYVPAASRVVVIDTNRWLNNTHVLR